MHLTRFKTGILLFCVLQGTGAAAQTAVAAALKITRPVAGEPAPADSLLPAPLRVVENNAFALGEKLLFDIRYGPIRAGESSMEIPEIVYVDGHPTYLIQTKAWSNSFFSRFYRVKDIVESYIDTRGIFTWKYEKHLREGSYKADRVYTFDQTKQQVFYKGDTLAAPPFVQDVLSSLYYIRTQELVPGDTLSLDNHSGKKFYPLNVIIHKREQIKVRAGKFDCIVVEPVLEEEGIFKQKGRIIVHMTDDERKIPVLMTSKINVKGFDLGDVVAELTKISGVPGY